MNSLMARLQSGKGYLLSAIIVAGLQTVILGTIIQSRASILNNGAEVLLKTAPVDPRDFLRGDYVVLNYDISSVPVQTVSGGIPAEPGERTLWVRLKKQEDGFWTVIESSFHQLPPLPETVILRSQPFYSGGLAAGDSIRVEYGIERYYVPEGQGKPIEEARNGGNVAIAVRVSPAGSAQIRGLLVDGKPVYDEPLY
ncbi:MULTISPECIES: GDYXXLXY domain-containing protein [Rhizobium]|uniref:GDYXXLXY domain-containing protein n=1 Tax=Rhizobium TaxID=379 RepID=UPI000BE9416D|nr:MULTISPECIES: GDYXXLXY domain-containing protein [Rhizobium]MBB3523008.1 putative membrane-anchored protein [Rhizobium sp. BK456]MBY4589377.1 GDYXXLXY domain-containing protein [Rhizobium redzepovicii]MBY4613675.1 GDYXXLXY domain-containing protein [Rhizobium redzepovicii]MDF0658770.1 GDYXXLXY domain-containing protein [Rhizobium sp. BC49]MDR9782249.1 GDYXXLXY domain-containing protein [Rhizobium redzepovicii]